MEGLDSGLDQNLKAGDMQETPATTGITEPPLFAFDVPFDTRADEAANLIVTGLPPGFFVFQLVPWPGAGMRVFCKMSKAARRRELGAKGLITFGRDKDGQQSEAVRYIKAHPHDSAPTISYALRAWGSPGAASG